MARGSKRERESTPTDAQLPARRAPYKFAVAVQQIHEEFLAFAHATDDDAMKLKALVEAGRLAEMVADKVGTQAKDVQLARLAIAAREDLRLSQAKLLQQEPIKPMNGNRANGTVKKRSSVDEHYEGEFDLEH